MREIEKRGFEGEGAEGVMMLRSGEKLGWDMNKAMV